MLPYVVRLSLFSENIIVLFFLMEYLVRFICSPRKWRFFKQPMNLVDFFAIIPFMLDLVIGGLQVEPTLSIKTNHHHHHYYFGQDFEIMGKAGKIVRLVRVMRVMRIFKLVRHFAGLQSLIYTLNQVSAIPVLTTLLHSSLARPTRSSGCSCCWWGSRSSHLPL